VKKQLKQLGQGMTEYIIIVALIAIAAIAVYSIFGDVIREQVGGMAQELAGTDSTQDAGGAITNVDAVAKEAGLGDYTDLNK
jgi:Flp pilus assembly pilin Flp